MDYEKKYKEALEMAEETIRYYKEHNRSNEASIEDLEQIFPELKESEDEKIRKELINVFSNREKYLIDQSFGDITVSEALAWLEKQGEQKPTDNKEKLGLLNFIRKETGCGLAEANNALLKLIKVLKQHPLPIMDKPRKLKIEWEE